MFERLPPKEGINNRISRFAFQALDKVLYPNSKRIISGGGQTPWSPTTRQELNNVARENDMRRYPDVGNSVIATMSEADHHAATELYKGLAKGEIFIIEPEIIIR